MSEAPYSPDCDFLLDGAVRCKDAVTGQLATIEAALADIPSGQAGVRLFGIAGLTPLAASDGPIGAFAAAILGEQCRPVRAILFDKTAGTNWALGWHQDRTLCVRKRIDVEGFGPWTVKNGVQHVAPPFGILSRMVTIRVHLDEVSPDNAPLLIARGSHLTGFVPVDAYVGIVESSEIAMCVADAGDLWIYATSILHASQAASAPRRRRVLQIDYSADALPGGLEWLGLS